MVAALVAWQCFVPPIVGLADNGDFEKVTGPLGLRHLDESSEAAHFGWVQREYVDVGEGWWDGGYLTSERLVAGFALALDRAVSDDLRFDVLQVGALHAVVFVAGLLSLAAATAGLPARPLFLALLAFVFTDVGYVSLLNTFYSQTASLIFLLPTFGAAVAWIRAPRPRPWVAVAYFACAALYVTSKPQAGPHAACLGLLAVAIAFGRGRWRWPVLAATLALGVLGFAYFRATPMAIRAHAIFNLVFAEILPRSPQPEADLVALGGERAWIRWLGSNIYTPGAPIYDVPLLDSLKARIGYRSVARYYARRPRRLLDTLERASAEALTLRAQWGNFERATGVRFGTRTTRRDEWSALRRAIFPARLWWIAAFFGANLAAAAVLARSAPTVEARLLGLVLGAASLLAITDFLVCALANAHIELQRHLFVFHALYDLCFLADLALLAIGLRAYRGKIRPRSAVGLP